MVTTQREASAATERRPGRDAVPALSVFLVVLLALPSRFVVGPLGAAGAPAQILGLLGVLWWSVHWLGQQRPDNPLRQQIRSAAFTFLVAVMISYVVATRRPISADELSQVDRGLLSAMSWLAVLMLTMDGITTRDGLDTLLRRLVLAGGFFAGLGVVQFFSGQSYLEFLHLPGLTESAAITDIADRSGFFRPTSTALHAIEFGVILTMLLPLALHYAAADTHRGKVVRWFPVVAIAIGLPTSISRSAIVGTVVGLLTLLPTWPAAWRRRVYAGGVGLVLCIFVLIPGFLGALLNLFTGVGNDSSAKSRTDSYAIAQEYIAKYPLFGRGFTTFLPSYHILDNQYLASLIDIGIFGLASVLVLFVLTVVTAWRLRDAAALPGPPGQAAAAVPAPARGPALGPALAASVAAATVSFAFFDAFSFSMVSALQFFLIGAVAALRRFSLEGDRPSSPPQKATTPP